MRVNKAKSILYTWGARVAVGFTHDWFALGLKRGKVMASDPPQSRTERDLM